MKSISTSISVQALTALALKSARSAPGLEDAIAACDRGNYLEAESMLLVAAHAGNHNAQELLGFMYAIGPELYPGIECRPTASKNWLEKASRSGRPAAQYMHVAFQRGLLEERMNGPS